MDSEPGQFLELRAEELNMSPTRFEQGAEKDVYRGIYQGQSVVVKVYREYDIDGKPVDQRTAARKEFQGYNLLQKTPLAKYTPKPYGLYVDTQGHTKGIIVEPKNGNVLGSIAKKVVPKEIFDQLELDVLNCQGIVPAGDMLMDANLGFDGNHLWFAEVMIEQIEDRDRYERVAKKEIGELRKLFQMEI